MLIVEVLLGGVVDLVRQLIELEHERQVGKTPHLHLRSFSRVTVTATSSK